MSIDVDKIFNEFLLSMVKEGNVSLIHELRLRWRNYMGQPYIPPPEENKSNDSFQWASEKLLEEFAIDVANKWHGDKSIKEIIKEFWERHTPKPQAENKPDWEIVKFELYYNKGSVVSARDENRKFKTRNGIIADEAYMLLKYPIHSVKRLSDGEVFSVGDEVEVANSKYKIQSFKPNPFQMEVHVGMSYPLHFASMKKLPPQPQKEEQRIEVEFQFMFPYGEHKGGGAYNLSSPVIISKEKLPLIKQAIESVLNNESPAFDWMFRYTQSQVDAMCEDAFNAAREVFEEQVTGRIEYSNGDWSLHHPPKYMNFKDYKQSKQ